MSDAQRAVDRKTVIEKINEVIGDLQKAQGETQNNKTSIDHFYRLKKRLESGQELTDKMKQNLSWIIDQMEKNHV